MADTRRELVLQAFKAALDGVAEASGGSVPDLLVERNRDIEVTHFPSLVQVDGGQTPFEDDTGIKRIDLRVDVELYAKADTSSGLAGALDQLYGATVAALLADHTLGGLAVDLREGELTDPAIDRSEGRGPTIEAALAFTVEYWVKPSNPFQPAP